MADDFSTAHMHIGKFHRRVTSKYRLMRARNLGVAVFGIIAPGCDCGGHITGDAGLDANGDGNGGWVCGDVDAAPYVPACSDQDKVKCQQWAQSLERTGYTHSTCVQSAGVMPLCTVGDYCSTVGNAICWCIAAGNRPCDPGYVCISDTPDGPRRCVKACSQ